jgi:hypothetical protein
MVADLADRGHPLSARQSDAHPKSRPCVFLFLEEKYMNELVSRIERLQRRVQKTMVHL